MLADGGIREIEFYQVVVAVPSLVLERFAIRAATGEVEVIPVAVSRRASLLANVAKGPEVAAGVVEHRVEHEANAAAMQFAADCGERGVVAEAPVHAEIVGDVVAVGARLEHGAEQERVRAEVREIIDPGREGRNAIRGRAFEGIARGRVEASEREEVI